MPTILESDIRIAKLIRKISTFEAGLKIGRQQQVNGAPLEPGASKVAVNQLLGSGELVINSDQKIDIPRENNFLSS